MGMAAAQTRFLSLTARKTNVEYQGQQINQARVALSNQSANHHRELWQAKVPVPPAVADYTKIFYTFANGNMTNELTFIHAKQNGEFSVSYKSTYMNDFAVVKDNSNVVTRLPQFNENGQEIGSIFMVGGQTLRQMGEMPSEEMRLADPHLRTLSDEALAKLLEQEREQVTSLLDTDKLRNKYDDDKYGLGDGGNWLVRYAQNSGTGVWEPNFYREDELKTTQYNEFNNSTSAINYYKIMPDVEETNIVQGVPARMGTDASGRFSSLTLNPGTDMEQTFQLFTNTVKDERAYDSAMNQYHYDKFNYEALVARINASIRHIQAQDRTLELKLRQVDTEQLALQTEMEAITKIIDKNVENTFNLFY